MSSYWLVSEHPVSSTGKRYQHTTQINTSHVKNETGEFCDALSKHREYTCISVLKFKNLSIRV